VAVRDSLRAHVRQCQQALAAMAATLEAAGPEALPDLAAAQVLVRLAEIGYDLEALTDTLSDAVEPAVIAEGMTR
jgi:hypothetical protein